MTVKRKTKMMKKMKRRMNRRRIHEQYVGIIVKLQCFTDYSHLRTSFTIFLKKLNEK